MIRRQLPGIAVVVLGLAALAAPYLGAYAGQPEGSVFSGFLMNPVDGFSYFAKMRQGYEGSWLFQLPYAAEPGPGSVLFVYYLGLGHLERILGTSADIVYHGARLAGAALMVALSSLFLRTFLPSPAARRWAFGLTLFGSGLGWLGIALGRLPIDLWVPEAFPFLSGYANAHFALSAAGMLTAFVALETGSGSVASRVGAAAVAGLVLGAAQPFGVVVVALAALVWLAWNQWRPPATASGVSGGGRMLTLSAFLATGVPWVIYDAWITRTHPSLAAWSAQNITSTPSMSDVLLGLGLALPLSGFALWRSRAHLPSALRLLIVWIGIGLLLAFAPFALQRRMLLGIFFPVAGLAGFALADIAASAFRRGRSLAVLLFALCLPTTAFLVVGTTVRALRQEPDVVLSSSERDAYARLAEIAPEGSLVLTGEVSGNRLPAFARVRVIYGHPFETPDADDERRFVNDLLASAGPVEVVVQVLRDRSVDFVLIGDRERESGPLAWLAGLRLVDEQGGYAIYQVPAP